jgi:hypothetical protein
MWQFYLMQFSLSKRMMNTRNALVKGKLSRREMTQDCSKVRPIAARAAPAALKSEGRKPKSEGSPKPEIREGLQPLTGPAASEASLSGLRISDFLRISVFGIRIWAGSDRL